MLRRVWAGMLLLGTLQSASLGAQETSSQPRTADRPAVVLKVGEPPERAIRGQDDLPPGDRKVEAALERIVTLRCHDVPFGELAQEIERQLGIPVLLLNDPWSREEVDGNRKVTIDVDGVPLATALEELFSPDLLSLSTDDGKLILLPVEKGREVLRTSIYPVGRLQQVGIPRLIKIINTVTSGPWDDDELGTGPISSYGNALVVRQTYQTHRQIELLLHLMVQAYVKPKPDENLSNESAMPAERTASSAKSLTRTAVVPTSPERPAIELTVSEGPSGPIHGSGNLTPGDWVVETALRRIVTLRCQDVPLADVASEIERKLEIPVRFQTGDHPDSVVDPKQKVSIDARGVPLHRAISYVGPEQVRIYVAGGTLLFVPFGNGCDFSSTTRVYPVARFQALGFNQLKQVIQQEVGGSWNDWGWNRIDGFGDTFVIRQTPERHRDIDSLLSLLDRLSIQPVGGEQNSKAPAILPVEERPAGLPAKAVSLVSQAHVDMTFSLGPLAFRSSDRREKQPNDSVSQDGSATGSSKRSRIRLDVLGAPLMELHGSCDLTSEEMKLEIALERVVTLRCDDVPLEELAREIERKFDVPVRLQLGGPPEFGVDPREKVSIEVYGVPLVHAIDQGPAVRCVADRGELRFVHPEWESDELRRTRVYQVARFRAFGLDRLSELIHDETSGPWHDGEPGTGTLETAGETFVVSQTLKVHREIDDLFDLLDRLDIGPVPEDQQLTKPPPLRDGVGEGFF